MSANANATREGISKNNLLHAREACKRFVDEKAIAEQFIRTFEKKIGEPDSRFGFFKYKSIMRKTANRHLETIHIDLDDLADFCKKETKNPDGVFSQSEGSLSKIQLAQSLDMIVPDIEENTLRWQKYFYEICGLQMPERDEDFDREKAEIAQDMILKWRLKAMEEKGNTNAQETLPLKLRNNFDVCFKPRSSRDPMKMRDIRAKDVGSLVTMDCLVVRISGVKPKVEIVTYHCEVCGAEVFQSVESERYTPLMECPSQRCKDNKVSGKLNMNIRTCKFSKYQEMRVQELSEHVPVGGVPRSMNVIVNGDLTRSVLPGDAIQITGIYVPYVLPYNVQRQKGTTQEMYLQGHHIKKHKNGYNEQSADEQELSRKIDEASRAQDLYEDAAKSIAPEIFGHLDVKKALLLSLIGSFSKTMGDGMKIRGDIHVLLMGDPGVAKSQLMKQAVNIAPRSVYTTGKGSSGVGLTASVVRDNTTGEVTLEGGALVLADMGICCIDEFDKMEESDRTAIHEVMEQQTVSIAKAGITTTLNTRTTIMAAANPAYGRYNPYKSPVENIDLPHALLSRFDLLFLLLDTVEADRDKQLALHVCKVHSNWDASSSSRNTPDALNLGFKAFDGRFLRSYIRKAKTFEPMVDSKLQKDIVEAYVSMRDDEKRGDIDSRKSYTTPRSLLAILRLSQAHARARFSHKVERQDFDEAMRLLKASKESVEVSSPAKRDVSPLDTIYDIMADLSRRSKDPDGWFEVRNVVSMAGHKAMSEDMCEEAIDNWVSLNVIQHSEDKSLVRFAVPP